MAKVANWKVNKRFKKKKKKERKKERKKETGKNQRIKIIKLGGKLI